MAVLRDWPPNIQANLTYTLPCEGCSSCYVSPPAVEWRWWHVFMPPRREGEFWSSYPTAFKGYDSQMAGEWAGGQWEKACLGCISEIVRCKMLIFGRDIGWGV